MVTRVPDPTPEISEQILALETRQGGTVRAYLTELLAGLWLGEADPKYGMTGESDWHYDLYEPMRDAGLIPPWRDGYGVGYREGAAPSGHAPSNSEDRQRADALICAAIVYAMEG